MSDRALSNAKLKRNQLLDRKKALRSEIETVDIQLNAVEAFIANWHEFANADPNLPVEEITIRSENEKGTYDFGMKTTIRNSKKEDVAAVARELILERGAPIMRDELYDLLVGRGLVIEGKDPHMVLSTMLWRMRNQLARVKGGGYWPADVPNVAAEYDPANAKDFDTALNKPVSEILDPDSAISTDSRNRADEGGDNGDLF